MFIVALFTTTKLWKQPKCPSVYEAVPTIYTMEYYLTIKKKKILPFQAEWIDLDNMMLNEISQSEKDKYHIISLIYGI